MHAPRPHRKIEPVGKPAASGDLARVVNGPAADCPQAVGHTGRPSARASVPAITPIGAASGTATCPPPPSLACRVGSPATEPPLSSPRRTSCPSKDNEIARSPTPRTLSVHPLGSPAMLVGWPCHCREALPCSPTRRWLRSTTTRSKLFRLQGEFTWRTHHDTDELFLVTNRQLTIQTRDGNVKLGVGQLFVVPRGVEHGSVADGEVPAVLIEPAGVVNTGDWRHRRPAYGRPVTTPWRSRTQ